MNSEVAARDALIDNGFASRADAPPPVKVALVSSNGGHLSHLLQLREWWSARPRFWVTFAKPDAVSRLIGERVYWAYSPTNRNLRNVLRNFLLAIRVLRRERPDVVITSGAGVAVPFAYAAKLLGIRFVFIEVVDRIDSPTLSGRLVEPVADLMLVQWPEQRRLYRKARVVGRLL